MAVDAEDRSSWSDYAGETPQTASDTSGQGGYDPREADRTKIIQAYQQYLKRTPSEQEIQSHLGNPGGIDAALKVIQGAANTAREPQSRPSASGNTYGTNVNLDRGYLEQQIRAAFAEKGNNNPSQSEIDQWVKYATTPDVYSDGKTRVGWNNYLKQRLITGQSSADPSLAGDEGVIANPGQYGLGGGGGASGGTFDLNSPLLKQFDVAAPTIPQYAAFHAPTWQEAYNDPGYQFALQQGQKALQGSAAARGMLNTSGTLKSLSNYNQQAAAQQYGNVYNRALQDYNVNYQTQAVNPYAAQYQQWQDKYNQYRNWQNDVWNKTSSYAGA